ncbi:MAG: DNA-processing protein DprA [Nocardioides sp.]|uniref:DNA-processing protein DprA n=1 Tax=Nocardioides sp. TaxID=35761 RepID=UPI0039E24C71
MVLERGSVEEVLDELDPTELFVSANQKAARAEGLAQAKEWVNDGLRFCTILDGCYPASVREIHQAPPFLFAAGELRDEDPAVSVVGSRKASQRGLGMARNIAQALVQRKLSVIAGLAAGIDTAAHTAALEAQGRTVALIATGIRRQYPAENRALHDEIASKGLLLSQFWPDAPPQKHNFLMRNATMSGYGLATIVVEAGEYSGARAQARMAVEHGRPVILTDLVVDSTEWGRSFVGRPGVTVASSMDEVMSAVDEIRAQADRIDTILGGLVAV